VQGVFGWDCAQWVAAVRQVHEITSANGGVPILVGLDSLHGVNYVLGATLFPHNIGAAATWNPSLVELRQVFC